MEKEYLPRIMDNILKKTLNRVGAVLIAGPKWCGKTTTAQRQAKSVLKMQDPDKTKSYLATADTKPSLLLIGEKPRLIDEWQMAPVLWDAVRISVDDLGEDGLYILTGSTSVDKTQIMHSGTGRISKLVMLPMTLYESKESEGNVSLIDLFDNPNLNIDGKKSKLSVEDIIYCACRGGWPSSLAKKDKQDSLFVAKSYLDNICDSDCSTVDGVKRNARTMQKVLRSYARNVSTLVTDQSLLDDIAINDTSINIKTLKSYLQALEKLFVVEEIPAWNPSIRSATAMRSSNKREFTDPSIAVAALGLTPQMLMQDLNTFGYIFETLCIRDLKVYSSNFGGEVSYYHDKSGLEADCVLHLNDGRYALIEFKLGSKQIEEASQHLLKLKSLIQEHNIKKPKQRLREPDLLVVITGGEMAYTRADGVKIIPIGCLKD